MTLLSNLYREAKKSRVEHDELQIKAMISTLVKEEMDNHKLLALRVYSLGISSTKKVIIGSEVTGDKHFSPLLTIVNHKSWRGLRFDANTWARFKLNFGIFSLFYNHDYKIPDVAVISPKMYIKTQVIDSIREITILPTEFNNANAAPLVFDKQTFDDLLQIVPCIDSYFIHVSEISRALENLNQQLVDHICKIYRNDFTHDRDYVFLRAVIRDLRLNDMDRIITNPPQGLSPHLNQNLYNELLSLHTNALIRQVKHSM